VTDRKPRRRIGKRPVYKVSILARRWKLSQVISLTFLSLVLALAILGSAMSQRPLLADVGSSIGTP